MQAKLLIQLNQISSELYVECSDNWEHNGIIVLVHKGNVLFEIMFKQIYLVGTIFYLVSPKNF